MYNPISTYRIQFNKDFTFKNLKEIIPYLVRLGIRTIYASPVFKAVKSSTHGYDITDYNCINPEIGTIEELYELTNILKLNGIGWVQDIVPNHMALHPDNDWLMHVLEYGRASKYFSYFDFCLEGKKEKIMIPVLVEATEEAISQNKLKIVLDSGKIKLFYKGSFFPVNEQTNLIFKCPGLNGLFNEQRLSILTENGNTQRDRKNIERITKNIVQCNADPDVLLSVLKLQHYELCCWKETLKRINYRRFFTVNELICMRQESEEVFEHTHLLVLKLINDKVFDGLRVDHLDGLNDPDKYIHLLRKIIGPEKYLIVEKILQPGELLPETFPTQGTTGYNFLRITNNLLSNRSNLAMLEKFYISRIKKNDFKQNAIHTSKRFYLQEYMQAELRNLSNYFYSLNLPIEISDHKLKLFLECFLVRFPVYRFYNIRTSVSHKEKQSLIGLLTQITYDASHLSEITNFFSKYLDDRVREEDISKKVELFFNRLMQYTGPLMAKGLEDTLMYSYNVFVCHNEVGDDPFSSGITVEQFHKLMEDRSKSGSLELNASSTHDTKRGEDFRARLNILSDVAEDWLSLSKKWLDGNSTHKSNGAPDLNDEYFIYQTLTGSYPLTENSEEYKTRLKSIHYKITERV